MKRNGWKSLAKRLALLVTAISLFLLTGLSGSVLASGSTPLILDDSDADEPTFIEGRQFEKMGETSALALYVVKNGTYAGEFYIEQKANGTKWFSNPQDRFTDEESRGAAKMALNAQLLFYYYDSELNARSAVVNSFVGKDNDVEVLVREIENGAKLIYRFSNLKIALALYVELHNDAFKAYIKTDEIVEQGGNYVMDISLLPYFGSAGKGESGYLLVSDGSGGVIEFANANAHQPYVERIYGEDLGFAKDSQSHKGEQVHLPVYGLSREDGGFLGIITGGDAVAGINAYVSGLYNSQNNIYTSYTVRNAGVISLGQSNTMWTASNEQFDLENKQTDLCEMTYYFLDAQAGYSGMAQRYRQYLSDTKQLQATEVAAMPPLYLELYGGVMKQTHFLGIPIQRYTPMTSFSQAEEMVRYFTEQGADDTIVLLRNTDSAQAKGKLQNKVRFASGMGGKKALAGLVETAGQTFLTYQPMNITSGGNGFSRFFHAAKRYDRNPLIQISYKPSTYYKDLTVKDRFVMRPELFVKKSAQYAASVGKLSGVGIATVDVGTVLPANYDEKHYVTRTQSVDYMQETLAQLSGAVYAPNAYALKNASVLTDIPFGNSELDIISYNVPFYQLVVSGQKEFSLTAFNIGDAMEEDFFLKSVETGAGMKGTLVYENADAVIDTPLDHLYGTNFDLWKSVLTERQNQLQQIFTEIGSREMIAHEQLSAGVYCTTFRSGKKAVVNYNQSSVDTVYGTVSAKSWLIVK